MKNALTTITIIIATALLLGCDNQMQQQSSDEKFKQELSALQADYHNMDQAFSARHDDDDTKTAAGAAKMLKGSDEYFAACKNIFDRQDALFAKYNRQLAPENVAYVTATLHYGQATHDFWFFLAAHGGAQQHHNPSDEKEFQRIEKTLEAASAEQHKASAALHQAKAEAK